MTYQVAAFRSAVLGGTIHWGEVAISGFFGVLLFIGGCLYFRKMESSFADTI
jgi:lipopolysaccharide transport system permease protein